MDKTLESKRELIPTFAGMAEKKNKPQYLVL